MKTPKSHINGLLKQIIDNRLINGDISFGWFGNVKDYTFMGYKQRTLEYECECRYIEDGLYKYIIISEDQVSNYIKSVRDEKLNNLGI